MPLARVFLCGITLGGIFLTTATHAAVIESSTAPTVDAYDIANLPTVNTSINNDPNNNQALDGGAGQYFTPDASQASYKLDSFSFKGGGSSYGGSGNLTYQLGTYTFQGPTPANNYSFGIFTPIATYSQSITPTSTSDWFTVSASDLSATPILLTAGVQYGFRISSVDFGQIWSNTNNNTVANAGWFSGFNLFNQPQDRLFVASLSAVPEPASLGALALGGLGLTRRRRRSA